MTHLTPDRVGTVVRLLADRGFGFIRTSDGTDYFFHRQACGADYDALAEGTAVTFRLEWAGPKGVRADDVRRA